MLTAASAANGAVLGPLGVAGPALVLSRHATALAGGLSAVCAAGELAAGVMHGSGTWPLPLCARLAAALLASIAASASSSLSSVSFHNLFTDADAQAMKLSTFAHPPGRRAGAWPGGTPAGRGR